MVEKSEKSEKKFCIGNWWYELIGNGTRHNKQSDKQSQYIQNVEIKMFHHELLQTYRVILHYSDERFRKYTTVINIHL